MKYMNAPLKLHEVIWGKISKMDTNHNEFPTVPRPDMSLLSESQNWLVYEELNYDRESLTDDHIRIMLTMTWEKRRVYDRNMDGVNEKSLVYFFFVVVVE